MSRTEAPIPSHAHPHAPPHLLAQAGGELAGLPELPRRGRGLSLRTLIVLRWLAVIGQTSAILTAYFALHFPLPLWECLTVIGAGVVMKEGLSIRGLTTAASIWMTAAIGILLGLTFYAPALFAALITLLVLSLFRWIESAIPALHYGKLTVRFAHDSIMPQPLLQELIAQHGLNAANPSYALKDNSEMFEYVMIIRTRKRDDYRRLAESLTHLSQVREFSIETTGD